MTYLIIFDTDNAAFEDDDRPSEVAFVLEQIPRSGNKEGVLRDSNGNHVGAWVYRPRPGPSGSSDITIEALEKVCEPLK